MKWIKRLLKCYLTFCRIKEHNNVFHLVQIIYIYKFRGMNWKYKTIILLIVPLPLIFYRSSKNGMNRTFLKCYSTFCSIKEHDNVFHTVQIIYIRNTIVNLSGPAAEIILINQRIMYVCVSGVI